MTKEKQIEEMARVIRDVPAWDEARFGYYESHAKALYTAGYRKASEVAREIVAKAIDKAVCKDNGDGTERLCISIGELRDIILC